MITRAIGKHRRYVGGGVDHQAQPAGLQLQRNRIDRTADQGRWTRGRNADPARHMIGFMTDDVALRLGIVLHDHVEGLAAWRARSPRSDSLSP